MVKCSFAYYHDTTFLQDWLISRSRKATGRLRQEERLKAAVPGAILLPVGLLIFGFMIHNNKLHASYVGACAGMAVRSLPLSNTVNQH